MKNRVLIFIFSFMFLYAQTAMAILPLLAAGARVISAGLKTSAGQDIAIGSALGVGLIFAQLNWQRQGTDGSSRTDTLYYTNTPRPPSAIESAAGFTAGSPSLVPPSTSLATIQWRPSDGVGSFSTGDAAARDYITRAYTQWHTDSTNVNPALSNQWIAHVTANNNAGLHQDVISAISFTACPSGYTASGNNCNLTNSSTVVRPSDGLCPITRSGNTYASDTTDPDCATSSPTFAPDGSFSVSGADGTQISSAPTGVSGERKIVYSYPDTTQNITKQREIYFQDGSTASSAPTVTGVNDKVFAGTGSAASGTPVQPVVSGGADSSAAVNAAAAAEAARDAAAAAAAAAIPALPVNPASVPALNLPTSNPFSSVMPFSGLSLPSNDGSCVNLSVSLPYMGTMDISPCAVVSAVRPMVDFMIVALGVIGGVLVWMRPEGEAA